MPPKRKTSVPTPALVLYDFKVEEELDLHGMALDEALAMAEQLLERYRRKSGSILRIVHGHSNSAPDSIRKSLHRNFATVWKRHVKRYRLDFNNPGATLLEISGA
jgi:DNA-nicking Smr family endonuclease